ncbi:hypothetical protein CLCR_04382 [Cladophialophora carrionii]|uniref:Uncharacterized protein n=1 Tax=Cladophialophora carrionii TaxID=86049 RepID=A0A1C1CHW9_9EURO|nr:hypothetical protein CLCR_04382 [Cladophialophora carrionii]
MSTGTEDRLLRNLISFVVIIAIVFLLIWLKRKRERHVRVDGLSRDRNAIRVAPVGYTCEDLIIRPLPPAYEPRGRAQNGIHPRMSGLTPRALRSKRPRSFHTYPGPAGEDTPSNIDDGQSSSPDTLTLVGGDHAGCVIRANTANENIQDDNHFLSWNTSSSASSTLPPYLQSDPHGPPKYER